MSCVALAICALGVGCGAPATTVAPAGPGVLTLTVTPTAPAVDGLSIASGTVHLPGITVFGDVAPDDRFMLPELRLDLVQTPGPSFRFDKLPQGLYSRVRFWVERIAIEGTWRGRPLHVQFELSDDDGHQMIDLRSATGQELLPGHDVAFSVGIDVGSWFAGQVLDQATPINGEISVNGFFNVRVAQQIASRIAGSFSLADDAVQGSSDPR